MGQGDGGFKPLPPLREDLADTANPWVRLQPQPLMDLLSGEVLNAQDPSGSSEVFVSNRPCLEPKVFALYFSYMLAFLRIYHTYISSLNPVWVTPCLSVRISGNNLPLFGPILPSYRCIQFVKPIYPFHIEASDTPTALFPTVGFP